MVRMNEVGENFWRKQSRRSADFIIRPNVAHVEWFDFSDPQRLIALGRDAALRALPELKAAMQEKSRLLHS
jgi:NTE family protein